MTMKNKRDAVKALSAAGWSPTEIKSVLGNASEFLTPAQSRTDASWWTYMNDDQFTNGNPLVEDWYNWLERDKPA
jgi:hypothetical protein